MAKKNFFNTTSKVVGTLAMVLALSFGLVLAGCNPDGDDGTDPGTDPGGGGTIKLAQDGTNKFTLTLTGLKWTANAATLLTGIGDLRGVYFALDGDVTAAGADASNPAISSEGNIHASWERTSDTVLTCTMSQYIFNSNYYWGSGKIKLRPATDGNNQGALSFYSYLYIDGAESISPDNFEVLKSKLSIAADSASVNFNIAKRE